VPSDRADCSFSQVLVHERASRELLLHNSGAEAYEFFWDAVTPPLDIEPISGSVAAGACLACQVVFCPAAAGSLAGRHITCRVTHGRTYAFSLTGVPKRCLTQSCLSAADGCSSRRRYWPSRPVAVWLLRSTACEYAYKAHVKQHHGEG